MDPQITHMINWINNLKSQKVLVTYEERVKVTEKKVVTDKKTGKKVEIEVPVVPLEYKIVQRKKLISNEQRILKEIKKKVLFIFT